MGHVWEIRRRGLPVDMPVFLPGLGAYVRWSAIGVCAETRSVVSLAGPFAGTLAAAACVWLGTVTGEAFWMGLAGLSALLNVLNLIPILSLDGSHAIGALARNERLALAAAAALFAAVFAQPVLLLVAAGACYRAFTTDLPVESSRLVAVYYGLMLAALGSLLQVAPVG